MKAPSRSPSSEPFSRAVAISLGLHAVLFIAFAVRAVFYSPADIDLQSSIRVDMVALPDKASATLPPAPQPATPEPAPAAPPAPPKPAEPPPSVPVVNTKPVVQPESPKVNLDKSKPDPRAAQEAAIKRLEALDKISKMNSSAPTTATKSDAKPAPATVVKGNEVSSGSSLRGLTRREHQTYLDTVTQIVKGNWNLPGWLNNSNLSAKVRLYVDAQGVIVKKQITQASKNPVYDERVIAAIEASSPLPAPPSDLVNILAVDGIEIELVPD